MIEADARHEKVQLLDAVEGGRLVRFWLTDAGCGLRQPVEAERRSLEEKITANLTATERRYLISALAKICPSASDLPGERAEHDDPAR